MEGDGHEVKEWAWMTAGSAQQHMEVDPQAQQADSKPQVPPQGVQEPASSSPQAKPSPWGDWGASLQQWKDEQRRVNPSPIRQGPDVAS